MSAVETSASHSLHTQSRTLPAEELRLMTDALPATILLVEDHPVARLGLKHLIDSQPGLQVIGEARSAGEALALSSRERPDLVVLPLRIEGQLKGVELCRELVTLEHSPKVLIYSSYNSPGDASASFLSGAHSFVHKGEEAGQLVKAIHLTLAGQHVWLLGGEQSDAAARLERQAETAGLTKRELDVLGCMLQRFTNAQIARDLFIELPTVKTHVRRILSKLGVSTRRELF